jgi:hypothetical protein
MDTSQYRPDNTKTHTNTQTRTHAYTSIHMHMHTAEAAEIEPEAIERRGAKLPGEFGLVALRLKDLDLLVIKQDLQLVAARCCQGLDPLGAGAVAPQAVQPLLALPVVCRLPIPKHSLQQC